MQVGTTKDQGLFNKLSAAVHPGALPPVTLPQYNTIGQKGRCHLQDQSVVGKIILKSSLKNSTGGCQWQAVMNIIHSTTFG